MKIETAREKGIRILDRPPEGWKKDTGATTAPKGYSWYSNGKSRFSKYGGGREMALVKDTGT